LTTVLAVETIRGVNGKGKVTAEIRHYLSSAQLPPERPAAAIRNHWRIENGLHWVLDVGFNEDASRVRERNAARKTRRGTWPCCAGSRSTSSGPTPRSRPA
jgi:predicted transposase YbfD/YdcC